MKSYRNGTTRFHGETKNTKLFFKRYLVLVQLGYERKDEVHKLNDSLALFVLPSDFIMRNDKRVLTDSLRIVLRRPKRK